MSRCRSRNGRCPELQCQQTPHEVGEHVFDGIAWTDETSAETLEAKRVAEPLLAFFVFAHLPPHLAAVSKPFAEVADRIVQTLPPCRMREIALEKLIESKDAAVRARIASKP
jgi:hypothetical protein